MPVSCDEVKASSVRLQVRGHGVVRLFAGATCRSLGAAQGRARGGGLSFGTHAQPSPQHTHTPLPLLSHSFPWPLDNKRMRAVMDGHGVEGHHVSGFVRQRLPTCLLNQLLDAGAADGVGPGVSSSASPHSSHTEGVLPGPDPAEAASAGQKGAKGKGAGGKGGDKGAVQGVPRALEQAFVEVGGYGVAGSSGIVHETVCSVLCRPRNPKLMCPLSIAAKQAASSSNQTQPSSSPFYSAGGWPAQ